MKPKPLKSLSPRDEPQCFPPPQEDHDEVRSTRQAAAQIKVEVGELAGSIGRLKARLRCVTLDRCGGATVSDDKPRPANCELATELESLCVEVVDLRAEVEDIIQRLDL